ncbi:ABC transporter ATP-binding protein [Bordetella sp. BOR01]|uniref:ABC transporter ATP-binding protein n=1 Tax=Bordetella sp. BOR01 TaxID=2854779 RepID=UPI001C43FFA5|nr:ABC transporter ATP-binding protein [Bordetella sp. BOR01]MBV7487082.1 ABC transporter ATP-binding protein [Bordetella sp. BOR01]
MLNASISHQNGELDEHLHIEALQKTYDGRHNAVDGVSLTLRQGEFVTFLGPSGSGKTSTLAMVAGFEAPTAGEIRLRGTALTGVPPHKRNMGMVFQNYALFPHMSAVENVIFPLRMRKVTAADAAARARRVLDIVGLAQHRDRLPKQLSGGQQQRVALARALVFEPEVLLLDEPLSALDKNLREQMQLEIKRLHTEFGITSIFVTHDQSEAMTMSDRIAVFNAGRVEQFAPPMQVYAAPATHFVGSFVGESNFFGVRRLDPARGEYACDSLGRTLRAHSASDHAAGKDAYMMVRPESLRLLEQADSAEQDNVLDFQITGVVDYGASLLLSGLSGEVPVRIRVPGARARALANGSRHRIAWNAGDAHIVPRI